MTSQQSFSDTDELTFQKGDIFFIHNDLGDGWLWVTAHRTGEQGLVFRDLLTDLDENIDPNAVFPWFHRILTKNEAVERLVQGKTVKRKFYIGHYGLRGAGYPTSKLRVFVSRPFLDV